MNIKVRHAQPGDIDWIVNELRDFSDFFGTEYNMFEDEAYAVEKMLWIIKDQIAFVAEKDEELLGFIAGLVTPHLFNPNIIWLTEMFWWVPEEHRHSRAGLLLLNEFVDWGKENANWITLGLENSSPIKTESLAKRGFKLHERAFLMEVM